MSLSNHLETWAGSRLIRRLTNAIAVNHACRHIAQLDRAGAARSQQRCLRGLVHRARNTKFGQAHDFARIRTHGDFCRLVPLRTPSDFLVFAHQPNELWPEPALAHLPTAKGGIVSVSPTLLRDYRSAVLTGLAHLTAARPRGRFLHGQIVWVRSADTPTIDDVALARIPIAARPYVRSFHDGDPATLENRLTELTQSPVTCLIGAATDLVSLLDQARQRTGWHRVIDVWPKLAGMLWTGSPTDGDRLQRALADDDILAMQGWHEAHAPIAVEDPPHALRLLIDHGVFFEFIPLEALTSTRPVRLGIESLEPGGRYAMAVTSAAGVWACMLTEQIVVQQCDPPMIKILQSALESPRIKPQPIKTSAPRRRSLHTL